jgi:predicted nucleotidyltransferase
MPTPVESMRLVAQELNRLDVSFAFVGGCAVWLLVDRPDLTDFRPTDDVDVIVEVLTLNDFYKLENILRDAGFKHDTSEGAPICRWIVKGCRVDIMPVDSRPLGMNSRWFSEALKAAQPAILGKGLEAKVITGPFFLATKLSAFHDRGQLDLYGSPDIEDIVTVVDGSQHIIKEVTESSSDVRKFIAAGFSEIMRYGGFDDALVGHLSATFGARERATEVREKFSAIAAL